MNKMEVMKLILFLLDWGIKFALITICIPIEVIGLHTVIFKKCWGKQLVQKTNLSADTLCQCVLSVVSLSLIVFVSEINIFYFQQRSKMSLF